MFLIQYFCLHGILLLSKSYPEIESFWSTAKCRRTKYFDILYYIVLCAALCVIFSSKSKATVFPKHILKSKARDQSIQARKKLFCHVIVKYYWCNVSCEFLKARRGAKLEQTPQLSLLYYGRAVRYNHRRCSIRKLFIKISKHPQETPALEPIFKKFAEL